MARKPTPVLSLDAGALSFGKQALLADVPATVTAVADPRGVGVFLQGKAEKPAARLVFPLGHFGKVKRFTCCFRYDPWWDKPKTGTRAADVPVETQYLLAELADGSCAVFLPLLDARFRCSLEGDAEDRLCLVAESGDPAVVTDVVTGLFVACGADPYTLMPAAAESILAKMKTGRRRWDKPVPEFVDQFGWCTWDAFYHTVSQDNVRLGLESFAAGGVRPKMMILDDGWLSHRTFPTGENRLTGFQADATKFPGGLAPTVEMAKSEFGIECFVLWHTLQGYWGGIDPTAFPQYRVVEEERAFGPGIVRQSPEINKAFGSVVGVVAPEDIARFFQDFHRFLREQGIDGVKVDNQSSLEAVSRGLGGRVELMRRYHEALEGAAQVHFRGNLINCMSHGLEVFYGALNSNVTRSYTDFWPNDPASHGLHMYANAQNCLWLGEFIFPDWDMFQSAHPMGAYHAAGRAVSGGPVYVSDKPEAHNFDVLRKLVLSDGTILRADTHGRPTRDCLFRNPVEEDVLLKIFNHNGDAGIVGALNARFHKEPAERVSVTGTVSPADAEWLDGERFAVFAHQAGEVRVLDRQETWPLTLAEGEFELFTIVPIIDGFAPIGLADKYNSAGAVWCKGTDPDGSYGVTLCDGGRFLCWCAKRPGKVWVNDKVVRFGFDAKRGVLSVTIPAHGACEVRIG